MDSAAARRLLERLFEAAVARADPLRCLPPHLPEPGPGRTVVVGAGKAAAAMAEAVETHWKGPLSGVVVTRYGHAGGAPLRALQVLEAGHPVPDAASQRGAEAVLAAVRGLSAADRVLCLLSGGGSALLALPAPGLALAAKQAVTKALLASGAAIGEMNAVRKHLSAIKGGRLAAAAAPGAVLTLAISDVPGDDPAVIASGPTVADPTTFADARAILARYRIEPPPEIARHLAAAADETPKPGDPRLARAEYRLIARPADALAKAAETARAAGLRPRLLGDALEGEARRVAEDHARLALAARPGEVLLSGGETTVEVRGPGRGGRNGEFLLALALALDGRPGVYALAADTDGIDGSETNAGALIAPDTLARARARGLDAAAHLARNDSYGFFAALGDLVMTGPTRTNVNDFRAILAVGAASG